jgi:UDP-2,3-diacylglucosamine hydrolase
MEKRGPYYCFISDVHLGLQVSDPLERERKLLAALESLPDETVAIYLLGVIFDFWFEF